MLKNYLRSTIIVLLQAILPILVLMLAVPRVFKHSSSVMQWQDQLTWMKPWFFILHGLFYVLFIALWPKLISHLQRQNELTGKQLTTALNARWYLLATFFLIDALMLWR